MIVSPRLRYALEEASRLHRHQTRKDALHTPYISHLVGVMLILSSVTDDEDILIAGLLHDSLEDVPEYTEDILRDAFGDRVTSIVMTVTEIGKLHDVYTPWKQEKDAYLQQLDAGSDEALLVSLADKIHNAESCTDDALQQGNSLDGERFTSSSDERMWLYTEVYNRGRARLGDDHALVKMLHTTITR